MRFIKNLYHSADDFVRRLTFFIRMKPSFIIIGVQKGGSSSLYHYLTEHPDLKCPRRKELRYFDLNFKKSYNWYQSRFPISQDGKYTFEASPDYFFHPDVPARIKKYNSKIKLIAVLRDPISRAYSHYQMEVRKERESHQNFEDAVKFEMANSHRFEKGDDDFKYHTYLSRGRYYAQLTNWMKYFDKDQILVLNSHEMFKDPKAQLNRVCDFLKLPHFMPRNLEARNVGNYDPVSKELREDLIDYYQDDITNLVELLGDTSFDFYQQF